ncbi:DUF945 family protein [Ideonella sp. 4Y16]|uniref:DUF945 family protein n=1 Tax=Ideonella alba TaxID=2824118 RepID=A0A940Y7E4_9BURK|nr:DUF945 family protein [Ideonella alba]MBQ0929048.1 DUF945 family protein [Ideonella alba]MBQ0942992.1 DUF945 family protein [Ideonella alba]
MQGKTMAVAGGVVCALAAAGWVGAGAWSGQQLEAELQALQARPAGAGTAVRVSGLKHQRGLLSSSGELEVRLEPGCDAAEGQDEPVTLHVRYQASHLPLPTALMRFDWQALPTGDTGRAFAELFGQATTLSGRGSVTPGGALRSEMSLPELSVRRAGSALQVAASQGFISVHGKAVGFGWTWPRVVARGDGQAVEMKDVALDLDLSNRFLGTGSAQFAVGAMSTGLGQLEGLTLRSEARENGDRLDMSIRPAVAKLVAAGQALEGLALELHVKGLDTRSVETLTTTFSASCGLQALTASEGQAVRDAVQRLLTRGFSAGIGQLSGRSGEGAIDGQWSVELQPARGAQIRLAEQLRSSGRLDVGAGLLTPDQRQTLLAMGMAVEQASGLRASYDYADGLLKVNGRTLDAGGFQQTLAEADTRIAAQLAEWSAPRVAQAPAPVPVAATEVPAAAPAAAPEPAAEAAVTPPPAMAPTPVATECGDLETCVRQSLAAGRAQDVDTLRAQASRIDALPKPDVGNKAVARQHNTTGLDALKRNDLPAAVAALRLALRENPRDVEVAGNLGYALVKADRAAEASDVLLAALVLDPRRSSTWTPLAEALALSGRAADADAALWIAYQWSANREKSLAWYQDRADKETRPALQALYARQLRLVVADSGRR